MTPASVAERTAWLDARCAGRPDLHAEVSSLLAAYDASDAFLQPLGSATPDATAPALRRPAPRRGIEAGTPIGAWRLIREIGQGGMGTVFLAERADGVFTQQVAIKIIARVGRRSRRRAPLRRRTADPRLVQSSAHRHAPRRRHDRDGTGVSGDGARRRRADHLVAARSARRARHTPAICSGRSARASTRRISTASSTAI